MPPFPAACPFCGAALRAEDGLARCQACGVRLAPARSEAELRELYGESYFEAYAGGSYLDDPVRRSYEARRRLALLGRHVSSGRLLEIGCAAGFFLAEARAAGFDVLGIEPGAEMAAHAREKLGLDVRTATVAEADVRAGSLDAACAWHVVEHLARPVEDLARVRSMLRPGGVLAIEVPNAASPQAQRLGDAWPHWDHAHHVAHHTPASVRALLTGAGYEVVDVHTFPGTGYLPLARALRPLMLASLARESVILRAPLRRAHPERHELVRAVARNSG